MKTVVNINQSNSRCKQGEGPSFHLKLNWVLLKAHAIRTIIGRISINKYKKLNNNKKQNNKINKWSMGHIALQRRYCPTLKKGVTLYLNKLELKG